MVIMVFEISGAETPYYCSAYQKDIEYWQLEYKKSQKENKRLEVELMEAKNRLLEIGIKIPDITLNQICVQHNEHGRICWTR